MVIKYRVSTPHNIYPNLTIYEKYYEDAPETIIGFRLNANEGYVFYDPNDIYTNTNPETFEETTEFHYFSVMYFPKNYNFARFPYIAVLLNDDISNYD